MQVHVEPRIDVPLVAGTIAFRSGAAHDPPGKEGTARLCARLLRRGAWGYNATACETRIASLGGELWVEVTPVATLVHFRVLRRWLERFVDFLATLLARPELLPKEIARQKQVAAAELVSVQANDLALVARALRRTLFEGHPYGRPAAGTAASIAAIDRDDLLAFHKQHYRRENAVVALSGDLEHSLGLTLADRVLALLPAGDAHAEPIAPLPEVRGRRLVFVDKPSRVQAPIAMGGLAAHPRDDDYAPLLVANTAFGGTFSSRLVQEIRVKRGLSYGVASKLEANVHREMLVIESAPFGESAAECLELELRLLHHFRKYGLAEDELAFAKSYLVRSHPLWLETAQKRVEVPLRAALQSVPASYFESYASRVGAVTLEAANAAARACMPDDDLVIAVVGTFADIGEAVMRAAGPLADLVMLPPDFE